MKKFHRCITVSLMLFVIFACDKQATDTDTLYQVSTVDALLTGIYDGAVTCGELKNRGDFGLGTFNTLDGELIMLNGTVYQVAVDGLPVVVNDSVMTPFASVTFFESDITTNIDKTTDFDALKNRINAVLPTENTIYAVKITGTFEALTLRSVPVQNEPYPPLTEVVQEQTVFELENISGTLVGLKMPAWMDGINVGGYHFHFLADNLSAGGHVLDGTLTSGTILLDLTHGFELDIPEDAAFYNADLSPQDSAGAERTIIFN
ncbi:MAG: acetolactate decarboxylase [Deltaproteobacteria bacterium]|nr:acetolactate decarboxylase [Deltaproteobacteria bacterium]